MSEKFEDGELKAYLSGDLPPEASARLEATLEGDADLEARLLAMETLSGPLSTVFANVPDTRRLPELPAERSAQAGRWQTALPFGLVASIAGLVGVFLSGFVTPDRDLSWQEQVAVYQALYVAETVAPLTPTPESLAVEFERASRALGIELDPADYAALPGLTLKRAQILGFEGAPLIQIAFAADTGAPIAFCVLKTDGTSDPRLTELSGLPTVHWSKDGYGFMVIGDMPKPALEALANRLVATL